MGSTPTVATELSREDGATIVLTGVTRDSVAEATSRRTSSTTSGPVRRRTRQLAENGQLFVVIAVLASRVLHVETSKKVAARIETSIPITAGVAPKIEPSGGSTGTVTLAWDGETPCHSASGRASGLSGQPLVQPRTLPVRSPTPQSRMPIPSGSFSFLTTTSSRLMWRRKVNDQFLGGGIPPIRARISGGHPFWGRATLTTRSTLLTSAHWRRTGAIRAIPR